nr:hypothetical protein [Tanacetum cinerariifolium]
MAEEDFLFLLTTLKVVNVLTTPMPELVEDATVKAIRIRVKWENDDYICKGHILNGMSDSLFDVCMNVESAKDLWDSLESKYMAEFLQITNSFIIDKLSSSWKDFKHTLKYGKKVGGLSVNMTEEGNNKQNKVKKRSNENKSSSGSNKKPKLECWKCGKTGDFKRDCRSGKKNNANAGGSGKGSKDHSQDQESRDVIFDEYRFFSIPRPNDIISNMQKSQIDDHTDDVLNEIPEPRKEDPRTHIEAMQSQDAAFWKEAIDDEIGSFRQCTSSDGDNVAPCLLRRLAAPYLLRGLVDPYFLTRLTAPYLLRGLAAPYFLRRLSAPYFLGRHYSSIIASEPEVAFVTSTISVDRCKVE